MTSQPSPLIREERRVASWDVDACNRLTTAALGRYLQETAESSAAIMGASFEDLRRANQAWVLYGMLLRVERLPRFRDRIVVETWPRDIVRRSALRDFRVYDAAGEVVARCSTSWYCLDLATRRPVQPDHWRTSPWLPDERALDRDPVRLPEVTAAEAEVAVPVRWSDLDLNGHVTNTRYQDLAVECYPADWLRTHRIKEFELNFLAEGQYPDTLLSRRQADPDAADAWRHALVRQSDGREIFRGRIVWRQA